MKLKTPGVCSVLLCSATALPRLSLAIVSIEKLLLVVPLLAVLFRDKRGVHELAALREMSTLRVVGVVILAFGSSLSWTFAPFQQAFTAFGKYDKFLVISELSCWIMAGGSGFPRDKSERRSRMLLPFEAAQP